MTSPTQIEKENTFFNLLELDLEDEEDSIFMSVLSDIASKRGMDTTAFFPSEDLRSTILNLPTFLVVKAKSLHLHLKHL